VADNKSMVATVIRWVALVASALVIVGFGAFAIDASREGSKEQVQSLSEGQRVPAKAHEHHGAVRRALDDADDAVLSPFSGVVDSNDRWVRHGIPSLLALLVYGVGLFLLANFLDSGRRRGHRGSVGFEASPPR
jgi:hypothetical protein